MKRIFLWESAGSVASAEGIRKTLVFFVEQGAGTARRETLMEAVRSNRSHRPGFSLNKVGPSQLMWAHSQIMWAEAKLQSQIIWAQNGDDLVCKVSPVRGMKAPEW